MAQATKRTRLAPEVRAGLILDEAARVITEEGVSAVNMERLGREAGISKALVYNYFPSRPALLAALLRREDAALQEQGRTAAATSGDFAGLVRATTRVYLEHVATRGVLLQRLMNEPTVALALREPHAERQMTVRFFAEAARREYGLDRETAAMACDMLMGLTGAAGDYLFRSGADIAAVEAMAVRMIMAALRELATPAG